MLTLEDSDTRAGATVDDLALARLADHIFLGFSRRVDIGADVIGALKGPGWVASRVQAFLHLDLCCRGALFLCCGSRLLRGTCVAEA